jgi:hypothetical protein
MLKKCYDHHVVSEMNLMPIITPRMEVRFPTPREDEASQES